MLNQLRAAYEKRKEEKAAEKEREKEVTYVAFLNRQFVSAIYEELYEMPFSNFVRRGRELQRNCKKFRKNSTTPVIFTRNVEKR